jgi:hypothetical protein
MKSANALKVQRQTSAMVSNLINTDRAIVQQLYQVEDKLTGRVLASHLSFVQVNKQFNVRGIKMIPIINVRGVS